VAGAEATAPRPHPLGTAPKHSTTDLRRQRNLLAAPPTTNDEEKEATTMATTTPKSGKGEPAKQVAIDILRTAGEPLHAKEIAKRVLASGRGVGLKGKTPEATISAMLAVGSKPGGPFKRVGKGTYALAESAAASKPAESAEPAAGPKPAQPAAPKAAPQARKPAQMQKPKRVTPKRQAAKRTR
jgi:hypothetical protein